MNSKEVVKMLIKEKGTTNAEVASRIGITNAAIWDRLNSEKAKSLTINKLNEMLRALDYEIVIMPRAKAGKIDNAYVIEE